MRLRHGTVATAIIFFTSFLSLSWYTAWQNGKGKAGDVRHGFLPSSHHSQHNGPKIAQVIAVSVGNIVITKVDSTFGSCVTLSMEKRKKSKELSVDLRAKIVEKHGQSQGYKSISRDLNVPVSTVRNVIKKFVAHGTV
ncbi:hypothetical protein L3Q82_017602 [Scortum barcoo]|uniref:Uncharacterized protein n=1 Tax=Scortum barcoo TaxID=214431 RepID=A0ACB8VLL3_9TELE|nr:hypothetical protein L3Q82_017602 [Scortum barcoo]